MLGPPDPYVHGHHRSVLAAHSWRTLENSAAYLLPHLRPGLSVIDVGCGPGTITLDLAERVAPGDVVGIDAASAALDEARARLAEQPRANCRFEAGDVYRLDVVDGSVDVVHAHQLLQHLRDPVAALQEMRRVVRLGGIVAARDADYGAMAWTPADPQLDRWSELYHQIAARNGVDADAGRHLAGWARRAGFASVAASTSSWTFTSPEARRWWAGLWAERAIASSFAEQARAHGLAGAAELEEIADGFRRWAEAADGVFIVPHGEIVASG